MLLETGGEHVRFKPRPLTGTIERLRTVAPETLILDGQQRLTSLYQALMSQAAVETKDAKNKPIRRWYYIDMKKAVEADADREDALLSVPEDKRTKSFGGEVTLDVTTLEGEYAADLFPVNRIFGSADWRQAYSEYWNFDREKMRLFNDFDRDVIKRFEQYQVPVIALKKETPKEAVCLVFERVNTGGVALTVFELLTASFAADNFQLRDDWNAREQRLKKQHPVLRNLQNDDFLQAISLLVTLTRRRDALRGGTPVDKAPGISCKRRDILKLEVGDWQAWADRVEAGFVRAARFLYGQKIFKARDLPYRYNSVINKTAISAPTNRQIGGKAPSKYLPAVEKAAGVEAGRMDEILASHCIAPELLRADKFWDFYAARAETLLQRIEAATGKNITREPELFRIGVVAEVYDEGPTDWDAEEPLEQVVS